MNEFLLLLPVILFPATAAAVFIYLRSSFKLLELVKTNDALWQELGCPTVGWTNEGDREFKTITPLLPWLWWIWSGNTSELDHAIATRLASTRQALTIGMLLFVLTTLAIVALVLSSM